MAAWRRGRWSCASYADPIYATTYTVPRHPEWPRRTVLLPTLRALAGYDGPAILNGAVGFQRRYVDLLAAGALRRRGRPVLVAEATWEPGTRQLDRRLGAGRPLRHDAPPVRRAAVARALMALIDGPRTHYGVLSTAELETFPRTWGVDPARTHFTPFCATAPDRGPREDDGRTDVFAGGNSLRDYRGLLDAAPAIRAPVRVATTLPLGPVRGVQAGPLAPAEYAERAAGAAIVVVALLAGTVRSAGHQTYLNAMLRGQAVVVTDAPGVRDHVDHGRTGLVVANEPQALAEAVNALVDDPSLRARLGAAARAEVLERYRTHHYFSRLLDLADRALR